jgi:hypothetical protein
MANPELLTQLSDIYGAHVEAVGKVQRFFSEVLMRLVLSYAQTRGVADDASSTAHTPIAALNSPEALAADKIARQAIQDGYSRNDVLINELKKLRASYPDLLHEMSFIYRVALWDALLPDVLKAVLLSRPEMLRSKKTLTHEEILGHADMASLTETMANKELMKLGYQSVADQRKWIQDHLGIDLFQNQAECNEVVEINARRNLLTHANGIVNELYVQAVTSTPLILGKRVEISTPYWRRADELLFNVAERLLVSIGDKFCPDERQPGSIHELAKRFFHMA